MQTDQVLPQHYLRESKIIIKCFLNYCRAHKEEIDVLFQMLSIFIVRTTMDFTFLKDFYTQEIAEVCRVGVWVCGMCGMCVGCVVCGDVRASVWGMKCNNTNILIRDTHQNRRKQFLASS